MWIFSKSGHLNLGQQGTDPGLLVVQSRTREDIDRFVALLDEVGGRKHEIHAVVQGGYRFEVVARKTVAAEAVARLVSGIDYSSLMRSMSFDFGAEPGYLLWMRPDGLQVMRVKPE
jgi:hypothetical protein